MLDPVVSAHPCWKGLPASLRLLPGQAEAFGLTVAHPTLAVAISGRGVRRYRTGLRTRELRSSPSMFEVYAETDLIDHASWDGLPGEIVGIQFPAVQVDRLLQPDGRGFRLVTRHELFDGRVAQLASDLWTEAREGGPRGKLYADGISLALIGLLVQDHGACTEVASQRASALSAAQRLRVEAFIEEHLADDLTVEQMASLVRLSAAQFSRAFKKTHGISPYAYVTLRRIERARCVLRGDPARPLAEVAVDLGFSSQSHFTEAFRRHTGVTPGRWRLGNG